MSRRQPKRRAGSMAYTAIAGFFIVAIVCGVGLGVASAAPDDDVARAGSFGFSKSVNNATAVAESQPIVDTVDEELWYERSALASTTPRDLDAGLQMIDEMERTKQARIIAENAAALKRVAAMKAKQGVDMASEEVAGEAPDPDAFEFDLPVVDWSVGKEAFVTEWAVRIDQYLEGSPLSGYGTVFAEASWDNGVDPRWSPAISNTESSKGSVCFRSYNAWGWGNTGWSDWDTAIHAHVAGLANGYGYSITPSAAQVYCPPTWADWYAKTFEQMSLI